MSCNHQSTVRVGDLCRRCYRLRVLNSEYQEAKARGQSALAGDLHDEIAKLEFELYFSQPRELSHAH